jgi:hypothetical protein
LGIGVWIQSRSSKTIGIALVQQQTIEAQLATLGPFPTSSIYSSLGVIALQDLGLRRITRSPTPKMINPIPQHGIVIDPKILTGGGPPWLR